MRLRPGVLALCAVGLAAGFAAVSALREATLSTHEQVDPDSRVEVLVRASAEGGEPGQTLHEMVSALLLTCRLEVTADLVGPLRDEGDGRYRAVLAPALDETNRRQFKGCVEDWTIDQLRADVVSFAPAPE